MRISRCLLGNKKLDEHSPNSKHLLQCNLMEKQPLEVFYKKTILKNFAKFKEKHLCQNLFLVSYRPQPATLFKRDPDTCIFL